MQTIRGGRLAALGVLAWALSQDLAGHPDGENREALGFNRHIRPILAENCFQCHGPDPGSRKAKLRLDRQEGFFGAREGGPLVVRGKPEGSPLYHRVVSADPEEVMPPPKSHKVLSAAQKELVRKWIAQGAPWEPHWSFIKPERPALPAVKNLAWIRTPVDRFILARLEAAGLAPSPEADRRTLARRLWLDLTGLPPEPAEVEAFVGDRSADAYERLVDTLLESPRYGEHRARYWLDAARYADTHGLHFDNFREIWPYRDWVIAAFNRNMPFDRFTVEQIAGDLLPEPTPEQIIATGFHRCNITTNEGGSINEEVLANYARERVESTSWVWLGLTANCCVCHDHKFDPLTMKDFYSFSAFFRNTTQGAMDGNVRDTAPVMVLPRPDDRARWSELPRLSEERRQKLSARRGILRADFDRWLEIALPEDWDQEIERLGPPAFRLPLDAEQPQDAIEGISKGVPVRARAGGPVRWDAGRGSEKALVLDGKSPLDMGDVGSFEKDTPFSCGCWLKLNKDFQGAASVFARMDDDEGFRGWDLYVENGEVVAHLIHKWKEDAIKVVTTGRPLRAGNWQHLFVTYDGSMKAEGFKIYVDGKESKLRFEANSLKSETRTPTPFLVGRRKKSAALGGGLVQDIRIYDRRLAAGEVQRLAMHLRARDLLARSPLDRPAKEKDELFEVLVSGDPEVAEASRALAGLDAETKAIRDRSPVAYVMEEKKGVMPTANILFRGEYDKPRDKVEPAVFASLHPLPPEAPKNRLGLARWLASKDNPLTPRVVVNRFWQEVFGVGLVKTAEDFGIMGDPPSHPELLDFLAVEFRDGGWDVKKIFRLMLCSATYRQSAATSREKVEKDPANRLLSRGPRFRMDAEMLRDYALSVGGILSPKLGGPSVKPYQPDGVWDAVGMRESNTKTYQRDSGEALYRRSLYTFWKRMAPPASLEILNAPAREFSCVRRERTNTPLQALVTLNDPQFIEAARALAQNCLKRSGGDPRGTLGEMARRVLGRPLGEREMSVVERGRERLLAHYRAHPEDAKALLTVGESRPEPSLDPAELAALTMISNELLNLDEVLNK
jgi:hypothetical protein